LLNGLHLARSQSSDGASDGKAKNALLTGGRTAWVRE
jgi:hypothetical protein